MEKIAVLLADGMFHNSYSEDEISKAKRKARLLSNQERQCKLFWIDSIELDNIKNKHGYDVKHYSLGELCYKSHKWAGTDLTLRYNSKENRCVQCIADKLLKSADYAKVKRREKYKENPDKFKDRRKQSYQNNKQKLDERNKQWKKDNPDKVRTMMQRVSGRKRADQSVYYSSPELLEQFAKFNNSCAYCGKEDEKMTVDHVYPIANMSVDCIRNVVPACHSCNSSKCNRELSVWYKNKPFYSKERFVRILIHTDYDQPIWTKEDQ